MNTLDKQIGDPRSVALQAGMGANLKAGLARLFVATLGGWVTVEILGWGLPGVFTAIAVGMICFAVLIAGPLLIHPWRGRAR